MNAAHPIQSPEQRHKLVHAILFLAEHTEHCSLSKLGQLLYLLDTQLLARTGSEVTGLHYYAWEQGPVPEELYRELGTPEGDLPAALGLTTPPVWNDETHAVCARASFDGSYFSTDEYDSLQQIAAQYRYADTSELLAITRRKGGAWGKVWNGGLGKHQVIPYALMRLLDDEEEDGATTARSYEELV
jgi:uncharacterized phage-associated protein